MSSIANRRSVMMLFSVPNCLHSHRARIVLAEKDITVDILDVDPDNKPEDLLDINPYSSVPTLVDRELVLYDSRVIIEYLDERFPHPPLMPVDPVSRAHTRLSLFRIENDWYSLAAELESGDSARVDAARLRLTEELIASNDIFAIKPFFLSDDFTLVDASLAPLLWRLPIYGIEIPNTAPDLQTYMQRLFAREGVQNSLSEVEKEWR